jgi:subtilase family serine protease
MTETDIARTPLKFWNRLLRTAVPDLRGNEGKRMRRNAIIIVVVVAAASLVSLTFAVGWSADHVILAGNHPDEAQTDASLGNADLSQSLAMEIHFALRNSAELDSLLKKQQDRSSPNFRKWLKTGEFDRRFGTRDADVKAVADWLSSEGFAVESTTARAIKFSGDVDHAQRSFAVRIARFDDGATYANLDDPSVPAQFASVIGAISGLDNMGHVVPAGRHPIAPVPLTSPLAIVGETEAFGEKTRAPRDGYWRSVLRRKRCSGARLARSSRFDRFAMV